LQIRFRRAAAVVGFAAAVAFAGPGPGNADLITGGDAAPGNDDSYEGTVSNSGRVVAFYSQSTNLGVLDANGNDQVYVRDLRAHTTELVSRDGAGAVGLTGSYYPMLSANGRLLLYYTTAANLAAGTATASQVVLYDRRTGETTQVSVNEAGDPADKNCNLYSTRPFSGNGRYAVFSSLATNLVAGDAAAKADVFLADLRAGTVVRITNGLAAEADGDSSYPSISPNGRWVVYVSKATNLVAGDANAKADVFLYDVKKGTTTLVSVAGNGDPSNGDSGPADEASPAISNNGRLVAFLSKATNLDPDQVDTNGFGDVFLRDLKAGTTKRISIGSAAVQGDDDCGTPTITPSGRTVTYWTYASNLVDATDTIDYDQVVYDVRTGGFTRMLHASAGGAPDDGVYGYWSGLSANGRWYACTTNAGNIDPADTNGRYDVYLVDLKKK
jgi:Tol biopolymer transport system component